MVFLGHTWAALSSISKIVVFITVSFLNVYPFREKKICDERKKNLRWKEKKIFCWQKKWLLYNEGNVHACIIVNATSWEQKNWKQKCSSRLSAKNLGQNDKVINNIPEVVFMRQYTVANLNSRHLVGMMLSTNLFQALLNSVRNFLRQLRYSLPLRSSSIWKFRMCFSFFFFNYSRWLNLKREFRWFNDSACFDFGAQVYRRMGQQVFNSKDFWCKKDLIASPFSAIGCW